MNSYFPLLCNYFSLILDLQKLLEVQQPKSFWDMLSLCLKKTFPDSHVLGVEYIHLYVWQSQAFYCDWNVPIDWAAKSVMGWDRVASWVLLI